MSNESFVFYKSFWNAIENLQSDEEKLKAYQFIIGYGITGDMPPSEQSMAYTIFLMAQPNIDSNNKKKIDGKKWWAPEWNQNARKNWNMVENWEIDTKQPVVDLENNQWLKNKTSNEDENEDENENEDIKKNEKRKWYGEFKKCLLTDKQYEKVLKDYWKKAWEMLIKQVDRYCASKGRAYKDYVAAIRNFAEKANIEKLPEKQENESWIYDLPF